MTARATLEASAAAFYGGVELGARNLVSGRHAPTDDLPGWQLAFVDDFNVDVPLGSFPADPTRWRAYPNTYIDTSGRGRYEPAKTISCAGSKMLLHVWWEDGYDKPHVACPCPIIVPGSPLPHTHLYGRLAVRWRLKSNNGNGFKTAWLLWPLSNSHANAEGGDGEIDFPEIIDFSPDGKAIALKGFVHWQEGYLPASSYQTKIVDTTIDATQWATDVIEWSPGLVVFLRNGVEMGRLTDADLTPPHSIPNTPMSWRLQTETALGAGTDTVPTDDMEIEIDWVGAWEYVA